MERSYPDQWKTFLERNTSLVSDIDVAIDGLRVYQDALHHFTDLLHAERERRDYTTADAFADLGLENAGVYAWRQLNPLLEKAADEFRKEGINPQEFYG